MQGDEFELVILDLVVTDPTRSGQGFLTDENRCNVAFTCAKSALIVLLPSSFTQEASTDNQDGDKKKTFLEAFARFMAKKGSFYPDFVPDGRCITVSVPSK